MIGIESKGGVIKAAYCHWDGNLSENGRILFESYQNLKKIKSLINFGRVDALRKDLKDYDCESKKYSPVKYSGRYGRDSLRTGDGIEFCYLWTNEGWLYRSLDVERWSKLTAKVIENEDL